MPPVLAAGAREEIRPAGRAAPRLCCHEDLLAALLDLPAGLVGYDGVTVGASSAYRREYIARAEDRTPEVVGKPYWD